MDNQAHFIEKIPEFLKLYVDQRADLVKQHKLRFNCLGQHRYSECTSAKRCFTKNCRGKHHSTLHIGKKLFQTPHNQKPNNTQLGTTVIKSFKHANNPIENLSDIRNQLNCMPVTFFIIGIKLDSYAILDKCSSCSYILSKTDEALQCKPSQPA